MRLSLFSDFLTALWPSSFWPVVMNADDSMAPSLISLSPITGITPSGDATFAFDDPRPFEARSDDFFPAQTSYESHLFEPIVNIDGTPMVGFVDINGNPYGVTESLCVESLNMFGTADDFFSGGTFESSDSFGSNNGMDFGSFGWE